MKVIKLCQIIARLDLKGARAVSRGITTWIGVHSALLPLLIFAWREKLFYVKNSNIPRIRSNYELKIRAIVF